MINRLPNARTRSDLRYARAALEFSNLPIRDGVACNTETLWNLKTDSKARDASLIS